MATIRRSDLIVFFALGCNLAFATLTFGQTIISSGPLSRIENVQTVTVTTQAVPRQHLGNGLIDRNNLPPDILNCEVCRQRLGLPPLTSVPNTISNAVPSVVKSPGINANTIPQPIVAPVGSTLANPQTGRMLGSPGMITSATAEQMEMNGMVVEEFKPPQPEQNAIQLGSLPAEVRQEFLRGLGLPPGARIMSAEIKGQTGGTGNNIADNKSEAAPAETVAAEAVQKTATAKAETISQTQSAVSPVIASPAPAPTTVDFESERNELKQTVEKLQKQLEEQTSAITTKKAQIEDEASSKKQAISAMQQQLEEKATKLNSQLEQFQFESKKRLEQSEATSKEALVMLEKRTAEVTELHLQLKAQQEASAKAQQEIATAKDALSKEGSASEKGSSSDKPDSKKKQQNKKKKPVKPTEL